MIPKLIPLAGSPWDVLPPGIHTASVAEVEAAFAYNAQRRSILDGFLAGVTSLATAGCGTILLDGSFVSAKPVPGDFDACWEPAGVDFDRLDPIFDDFENGRANQKARFKGEFFPSTLIAADIGRAFVEFFQVDRFTGRRKGILSIAIGTDAAVIRRVKP
jgi:hypothetical protein